MKNHPVLEELLVAQDKLVKAHIINVNPTFIKGHVKVANEICCKQFDTLDEYIDFCNQQSVSHYRSLGLHYILTKLAWVQSGKPTLVSNEHYDLITESLVSSIEE